MVAALGVFVMLSVLVPAMAAAVATMVSVVISVTAAVVVAASAVGTAPGVIVMVSVITAGAAAAAAPVGGMLLGDGCGASTDGGFDCLCHNSGTAAIAPMLAVTVSAVTAVAVRLTVWRQLRLWRWP